MLPKYQIEIDDNDIVCPYCKSRYQPEHEDFSEDDQVEECGDCGKHFYRHESVSISHWSKPDCDLNNDPHDWYLCTNHNLMCCTVCEAYRRPEEGEAENATKEADL